MTDLIAGAETWLAAQRRSHLAANVTISRGNVTTSSVPATQGSTRAENQTADGLAIRTKIIDFIIAAADYRFGGVEREPEPGDKLTDASNRVFEVMEIGSEACWRWHDRAGTEYRIHTKEI